MNKMLLTLLFRSIIDRRFSLGLIVVALAAAVALYVSVQNIQRMTRAGFENSVANVDVVVAARSSDIQILLNAVFGIGQSTRLMSAESVADVADFAETAWHVPVSLGDSHKGFRVIGTTAGMFRHVLENGNADVRFDKTLDAVIGIDVALALGYRRGDDLVLQHGVGDYGAAHDDLPFRIHHILQRSGTPFDRAIFIPLAASEAIHRGWRGAQRLVELKPAQVERKLADPHADAHHHDEEEHHGEHHDDAHDEDEHAHGPSGIDAVFVGLTSKRSVVRVQRKINEYDEEALMAVIPGVTLASIWQVIGFADRGFMVINLLIIGLVLLSMVAMTALSADNRRREMAILRALGASPRLLVGLMIGEAVLLSLAAALVGMAMAAGLSATAHEVLASRYGLMAESDFFLTDAWLAFYLVPAAILANLLPAMRLYRNSVNDGIMVKR